MKVEDLSRLDDFEIWLFGDWIVINQEARGWVIVDTGYFMVHSDYATHRIGRTHS